MSQRGWKPRVRVTPVCAREAQESLAVLAFSSSKKEPPPVGKAAFPSRSGPVPAPSAAAAALAFSSPKNPSGGEVAFLRASFPSPSPPAGPDDGGLSALRASRAARVFDIGFADGATGTAATATSADEVSADGHSDPAAAATANGAGAADPSPFGLAPADSPAPAAAIARALCCLVRSASTAGATFTGRRRGGGALLSHPPANSRCKPIFLAAGSHAFG